MGYFLPLMVDHPSNLRNSRFFSLVHGNLTAETGSIRTASTTTHSRFLPTCGDAPKMPTNGGLFQCVLRASRSLEGQTADFGPQSLRQKIPFLAPENAWCRELRPGAVAAGCALRLKSVNAKTGIRAGPDRAAQTATTIRPAHPASWRRRCRAEAALRRRP